MGFRCYLSFMHLAENAHMFLFGRIERGFLQLACFAYGNHEMHLLAVLLGSDERYASRAMSSTRTLRMRRDVRSAVSSSMISAAFVLICIVF